jgi:hypothetical protein
MKKHREKHGEKPREPKTDLPVEPREVKSESRVVLPPDPADVVPVPGAMSAAEIDERAKVVETLREERDTRERDSTVGDESRRRGGGSGTGDEMEEP